MPSKRQPSKQRRASQSRARRDALAARVEHASEPVPAKSSSESSSSSRSGSGSARRPGLLGSLFGGGAGGGGLFGGGGARGGSPRAAAARAIPEQRPASSYWGGQPGLVSLLIACGFGVVSFVWLLFGKLIPVDDQGEPIPTTFGGVYLQTRSLISGSTVERTRETVLDGLGPAFLLLYATPLVVLAVAFLMYRSTRKSRSLTAALLALAVLFFINIGLYYLPSLVFLGVAVYQARKFEMPERLAAQQAARDQSAEDDDEYDEDEEYDEEAEYEDEDYEDEYADDELEDGDEEYDEDDELVDEDEEADVEDEEADVEDEDVEPVAEDDEVIEPDEVLGEDEYESRIADGGKTRRRRKR